jgi:hypothetical protein
MFSKPTGKDRVESNLSKALKCIIDLKELSVKHQSSLVQKRIVCKKAKLKKIKERLVFLSTRARDKVTRFYAQNALKEISSRLRSD